MEDEWVRYGCQLALPGFGKEAQLKLQKAKVLIAGAGGLGCPAALYLASSGAGTIAIADDDVIAVSNLHRQILFTPDEVGLSKAEIACKKLSAQNPAIRLVAIAEKISGQNALRLMEDYDIVIDCTDNIESKYLLSDACVLAGKPLVYGAIYRCEGQLSVLNVMNGDGSRSPHYRDLFPRANAAAIPNCAEGGVMPTIAGIIGCMQANEVIKYITGMGELLSGKIFILDAAAMQSRIINVGGVSNTTINSLPQTSFVELISADELKNGLDKHAYELIDVRNTEERNNFHIGGRHMPLDDLATNLLMDEDDKPIVFYCQTGRRSAEAAKIAGKKFPRGHFFSLDGGLSAWEKTGLTIQENI